MTMQNTSAAGPSLKQIQQAPTHHDLFTDAHHVGVLNYLRTYQHISLTTLDIDCFIERAITDPAHPRAWNAGNLAGWLAGMASVEGSIDYAVAQVHDVGGKDAPLHLVEVISFLGTHQPVSHAAQQDEDSTLITVIPMEDPPLHSETHPFCDHPSCPCHEDQESITLIYGQYQEGLLTAEEATTIVNGKTV